MDCRICGRQFDALGFQVMVPRHQPHLRSGRLRARGERARGSRDSRGAAAAGRRRAPPSFAPSPALAIGPAPTQNAASAPHFFGGANIALLAAGTAATIYLWLGCSASTPGRSRSWPSAPHRPSGTTVAAAVDLTPATEVRPEPGDTVRGAGRCPAAAATSRFRRRPRPNRGRRPLAAQEAGRPPQAARRPGRPAGAESAAVRAAGRAQPAALRPDTDDPGSFVAARRPRPRPHAARRSEPRSSPRCPAAGPSRPPHTCRRRSCRQPVRACAGSPSSSSRSSASHWASPGCSWSGTTARTNCSPISPRRCPRSWKSSRTEIATCSSSLRRSPTSALDRSWSR